MEWWATHLFCLPPPLYIGSSVENATPYKLVIISLTHHQLQSSHLRKKRTVPTLFYMGTGKFNLAKRQVKLSSVMRAEEDKMNHITSISITCIERATPYIYIWMKMVQISQKPFVTWLKKGNTYKVDLNARSSISVQQKSKPCTIIYSSTQTLLLLAFVYSLRIKFSAFSLLLIIGCWVQFQGFQLISLGDV
jgi:hypothetical protein